MKRHQAASRDASRPPSSRPLSSRRDERALEGSVKAALDGLVADMHGRHEKAYEMMQRLDTNASGRLDRAELRKGLRDVGTALSEDELDALLREFDSNKDGRVKPPLEYLIGVADGMPTARACAWQYSF